MIISLDQMTTNRNVDNVTGVTSYSAAPKTVRTEKSGFQLGIADKVMDDEAYGSQGKTMEAVMQQAQLEDVTVQKNFMTVMSNSVSGEDLKAMKEEGYSAGSTDVDTYVDIVDKIKVTLAQAGVVIAGYNDDLSQDTVESITGSVSEAKELTESFASHGVNLTEENIKAVIDAIKQGMQLEGISDGMLQYMVQNHIAPTIENTYMAQFSATQSSYQAQGYFSDGTGYYARKAQQYDWSQLKEQMLQVCKDAGVDIDNPEELQKAMADSQFLIEQGIPLTVENLTQVSAINEIELPKTFHELADLALSAMENGKKPSEANLSGEENIYQKAEELVEEVLAITDEAVEQVISEGKAINIKNLTAAQKQIIREQNKNTSEKMADQEMSLEEAESYQATKAKRQLAEIQLMMTTQTNVKLLKSGYQLETKNLEQLVKDLKSIEAREQAILFKGNDAEENVQKAELFADTTEKINAMAMMPAAVIGRAIETGEKFTIGYVNSEGSVLKSTYQAAGESYEALMTAPRKDLGDSIQKAFRNVDDILKDMNLDTTEQNRRAVRILSYNQMEITEENINAVKSADLAVQNVMKKMTPGVTLQMIRDGVNPLEKSMQELDDYLEKQDRTEEKQAEKYAEYLYKLEQKNEVTPEEREAYIGIYRLFRQIEKSDGAVIGSLVNAQAEMNMKNLLSAVRSGKAKGLDVNVNDDFGMLQSVTEKGVKISDQIMGGFQESGEGEQSESQRQQIDYYKQLCKSIFDEISPDKLSESGLFDEDTWNEMNLEDLAYKLNEIEENQVDQEYYESVREECKQLAEVSENVIQTLMDYEQPVTMDNLLAANALMHKRGALFGKLDQTAETLDDTREAYEEAVNTLSEHFTGKEEAQAAYQKLIDSAKAVVEESIEGMEVTSVDVKAASLLFKQLSYISNVSKAENYEIPVTIAGEVTSVNLRIIHDREDKGKVSLTLQTKELGQVAAEIQVNKEQISGFIACDHKEALPVLENVKEALQEELVEKEDKRVQLQVVATNTLDIQKFDGKWEKQEKEIAEEDDVATSTLYRIAMKMIDSIGKV